MHPSVALDKRFATQQLAACVCVATDHHAVEVSLALHLLRKDKRGGEGEMITERERGRGTMGVRRAGNKAAAAAHNQAAL